jgi:DNA polymerase II small subunit
MKEDIEYLYSFNKDIRLAKKAYEYLLKNPIDKKILDEIINKKILFLDLETLLDLISSFKKLSFASDKTTADTFQDFKEKKENAPRANLDEQKIVEDLKTKKDSSKTIYDFNLDKNSNLKDKKIEPNITKEDLNSDQKTKISSTPSNTPKEVSQNVKVIEQSYQPIAKQYSSKIKVLSNVEQIINSNCKCSIEDFIGYFRDRYKQEFEILKNRKSNLSIIRLDQLSKANSQDVRIIVIVYDKKITEKGNLLLEVEDEFGQARAVVPSNAPCFKEAQTIMRDDIIALDGKVLNNLFIVNNISWPDLSLLKDFPSIEEDLAIVYLSDLHFGSRFFLEKGFNRFLKWLNGKEKYSSLASKVKYIAIAGDIVDGIGVYPSQENELVIKDIYKQYEEFNKALELIPDYISILVLPGNHDGVRRSEPQPPLEKEFINSSVYSLPSPCFVEIENFRHLFYHGTSLDSVIANIPGLSYSKPENAMKELLKRRHLSPLYGDNLVVPAGKDLMVIQSEPDVLHMGHVHKNAASKYRNVLMLNSGTFQDRTDFQMKMGHIPTPAIVPVLELKSGQLYHLKFLEEELI